jgi:hypothetical protein
VQGERVFAKTSRSLLKVLVEFFSTRWGNNPTSSTNSDRSGSAGADIELFARSAIFVAHMVSCTMCAPPNALVVRNDSCRTKPLVWDHEHPPSLLLSAGSL